MMNGIFRKRSDEDHDSREEGRGEGGRGATGGRWQRADVGEMREWKIIEEDEERRSGLAEVGMLGK